MVFFRDQAVRGRTLRTAYLMSVLEDLKTIHDAAIAAMAAGDYLTAKLGFMELLSRRASLLDMERSAGTGGRQSLKLPDVDVGPLIAQCDKMLAASRMASRGPFTSLPIKHVRPGGVDTY